MSLELLSSIKCHGGYQKIFSHESEELKCKMNFSVYIPPHSTPEEKFPVLFWLSGLTCTEKNFIEKSGFQAHAAKHKIIVVGPDTSPRGCNIEGEDDRYDLGTGAGFYVDATEDKWKTNYRMYSYVTKELPNLIDKEFPTTGTISIFGHSMGGHGALICGLKNPGKYKSVSAFAPISNPMKCPWGENAFTEYLGKDENNWKAYDATCLAGIYSGEILNIRIDQGDSDQFLSKGELLPEAFIEAAKHNKQISAEFHMQNGYDHSYYFISSFIADHVTFHASYLR